MSGDPFYIRVNCDAERVLANGMDMWKADPESKIWNGNYQDPNIELLFLAGEMKTTYEMNELFTQSIDIDKLESIYPENQFYNSIIINTPLDIQQVIVEVPNELIDLIGSNLLILSTGEKTSIDEVDKDPKMKPWYIGVLLTVPQLWFLDDDMYQVKSRFTVKCYTYAKKKKIVIE